MLALWLSAAAWTGTWSIANTVTIEAPPEVVWSVLVDFDRYADWNPWLIHAEGEAVVDARVNATVILTKPRPARHRVIEVVPQTRFCWHDLGWFTAMARGSRCRDLEAVEGGTLVRVELAVTGIASGMVEKKYGALMAAGLEAETLAWKAEAEARFAAE